VFPEDRESNKLRLWIYIARFLLLVRDSKPLVPLPHTLWTKICSLLKIAFYIPQKSCMVYVINPFPPQG
jgi:hypothetical protein